ncbi:hypothetical protein HGRIS_014419 [Hohenbuehelia grisea]|uniref:PUM-HD domain-containing protein n=1 Tax=Hohenbuehelia grisea TaxID=104357 RepID=A0ABR3JVI7_9AGAR
MAALQKSNKKRSATSQSGPAQKKVHLDKAAKSSKQQRRQPITASAPVAQDDSDDDEAWTDEDVVAGEEEHDEADMNVDSAPSAPKDPNAAREGHKAQKLLQDQRKASKPHSNLLLDAKRVWSLARQKNLPTEERQKHIHDLMDVIRGKVKDIVLKHDASRIVQTVVKWGRQKERDEIAAELKGKYRELAQNKYSKFLVTKLIRLSPTHRPEILMEFRSHVLRLLLHREASSVLADAFELYANAYERTILVRDFYGKEAALFSGGEDREKAKRGLQGVLDGLDTEPRRRILTATKESLTTVFNNPDKGAVTHAIVHRALWEYLTAVNEYPDEAEREKQRREMFECCQDVLTEMVHTKDGSRVVREFLAFGTAKERKVILKTLKPHIERMCLDDEAQLVLFTALDVIEYAERLVLFVSADTH